MFSKLINSNLPPIHVDQDGSKNLPRRHGGKTFQKEFSPRLCVSVVNSLSSVLVRVNTWQRSSKLIRLRIIRVGIIVEPFARFASVPARHYQDRKSTRLNSSHVS